MLEANDYQFSDPGKSSRSVMKQIKEERLRKDDEHGKKFGDILKVTRIYQCSKVSRRVIQRVKLLTLLLI